MKCIVKEPYELDYIKYKDETNKDEVIRFCEGKIVNIYEPLIIHTVNGNERLIPEQYVLKGPSGLFIVTEKYFNETYLPVSNKIE